MRRRFELLLEGVHMKVSEDPKRAAYYIELGLLAEAERVHGKAVLSPAPARSSAASAASGEVKSYRTDGGRVVFELGGSSAKLVSATPAQGWSMRVWTNTTSGHPPLVQIVDP
nr:hypothetical protein [Streptomyces finlayi]